FGAGTSLREAIAYANAHAGPDTISFHTSAFPRGAVATIALVGATLTLTDTSPTTIMGVGLVAVTRNGNARRLFEVAPDATAVIGGVLLTGGDASADTTFDSGGAIRNRGTLTLVDTA